MGIIFDLDQTLIESASAEKLRKARNWPTVYKQIPNFKVYDGLSMLLTRLAEAEIPLCIVTSSPRPYCERVVSHFRIPIVHSVCYHDTKNKKPHPEPILKAIDLMRCSAGDCCAIGDHAKDMHAAAAAGAFTIGVTWGLQDQGVELQECNLICQTVDELATYLLKRYGLVSD